MYNLKASSYKQNPSIFYRLNIKLVLSSIELFTCITLAYYRCFYNEYLFQLKSAAVLPLTKVRLGLELKNFPATYVSALLPSCRYLAEILLHLEEHGSILKTSYFQIGILDWMKYFVSFMFMKSLNRDVPKI